MFKKRLQQWVEKRNPRCSNTVHLHNRRLYILPTRFGIMYSFLLLVIFLAAINYQNSLSFALSFLLTSIGIVSLWKTHKNLLNLDIKLLKPKTVFNGEQLELMFQIKHSHSFAHYAVGLQYQQSAPCYCTINPQQTKNISLNLNTDQRGIFQLDGITIFTRFPTGLFHCWGWMQFEHPVLIYATPIATCLDSEIAEISDDGNNHTKCLDGDDFAGLREHKQGESLKHISWKAVAQGRGFLSKIYQGQSQPSLWLDWDNIQASSIEEKISKITSLILKADASNQQYGLKTPFVHINKNIGKAHKEQCLKALATYQQTRQGIFYVE